MGLVGGEEVKGEGCVWVDSRRRVLRDVKRGNWLGWASKPRLSLTQFQGDLDFPLKNWTNQDNDDDSNSHSNWILLVNRTN